MEHRIQPEAALKAQPEILTAWLFGSRARGTARPGSDVDVAVLVRPPPAELAHWTWDLEAKLALLLGLPVQVVPVAKAPADLVRRVLRDGVLLVDRDPATRIAFEVRKRNEYFDMTPIWRQIRRLPSGIAP